jgi:glucose/arabinose dehydrogenase
VALLLAGAAVLLGLPGTALAAPVLPAGFTVRDMPTGQARELTDFGFAPDGSWFTTGKDGRVAWVSADGRARTLAELPVVNVDDLGLTGLAVAADYATSKRIYTARAMAAADGRRFMRLSAWTVTGTPEPTGLSAERALFELPIDSTLHAMTGLVPAADGSLWVSVGESSDANFVDPRALRALDVNDGRGKVLHVLPDGRGVADNPFYDAADPSSWKSRVYASGFRSPFRMSLDPVSGRPVLGDVGWYTWEEVDLVQPGKSYGWPCWEGNTRTPGYTDLPGCAGVTNTAPVHTYVHGPLGTSVSGGIVYTGTSYPEAYRGAYFFGDYASARVYTMRFDAQGQLTRQPEAGGFISDGGGPVKFAAGPNGDIVYADIYTSVMKRLVYTTGNRPPTAVATASTDPATGVVTFDGSTSTDPDGNPLTHRWDFGDGTSATGARVTHTYAGGAAYTARLTVTDSLGATGTTTVSITPGNSPPVLTLTPPLAGKTFAVNELVQARATATDRESGTLPVTWSILLVHCSAGYCHDHPGESFTGAQFSRPFIDHGDETRMEVVATVTDPAGARVQQRFVAAPRLRTLTVTPSTPAAITVNGTARATATVTVGATVSLTAAETADNGTTFGSWSDGGARTRTFAMPDRNVAITATYLSPIDKRYAADATLRSSLGAPTGPEVGDAVARWRPYATGRMFWTATGGVKALYGPVWATYQAEGGLARFGEPLTDVLKTADGIGRYADLLGGPSIYYNPATGARLITGDIKRLWTSMGAEKNPLGYPKTSERATPDARGWFNDFQNGAIYASPQFGTHAVLGELYRAWGRTGYATGSLGYPLTDETRTADGLGKFNRFERGSVYWSAATGTHPVVGAIHTRWAALGYEKSYLGYPISDEYPVAGGRRIDFQRGTITLVTATGVVTDKKR